MESRAGDVRKDTQRSTLEENNDTCNTIKFIAASSSAHLSTASQGPVNLQKNEGKRSEGEGVEKEVELVTVSVPRYLPGSWA